MDRSCISDTSSLYKFLYENKDKLGSNQATLKGLKDKVEKLKDWRSKSYASFLSKQFKFDNGINFIRDKSTTEQGKLIYTITRSNKSEIKSYSEFFEALKEDADNYQSKGWIVWLEGLQVDLWEKGIFNGFRLDIEQMDGKLKVIIKGDVSKDRDINDQAHKENHRFRLVEDNFKAFSMTGYTVDEVETLAFNYVINRPAFKFFVTTSDQKGLYNFKFIFLKIYKK